MNRAIPAQKSAFTILFCLVACLAADDRIKTIVFEEFQIEGKIRRPQLVLIKAEQRPAFTPMVMQSLGNEINVSVFMKSSAVEKSPYTGAFLFSGEKITNYVP
ncbi:MAG: hypothetical protein L0Y76_08890 [Ignavibacteria bacterium]|nr:hypothetical protein [Ignavibacteria bacterium]